MKRFSHKISNILLNVYEIYDDKLPSIYCPPREFGLHPYHYHKRFEPFVDFAKRVEENGDPANRYRQYGVSVEKFDLHKLDEIVFLLRKIAVARDPILKHPLNKKLTDPAGNTFDYGVDFYDWNRHILRNPQHLETLRWRNHSFFGSSALSEKSILVGISCTNSPYVEANWTGKPGIDAINWIKENTKITKLDAIALQKLTSGNRTLLGF
ncbi:hypothetical protein [Gymnodinialimonas ulvae]|uniref:hypothetical protein n=1 Tax=Gymnodinialimonas ulvae TaxID=3126504 RepID=UPI0030EC366C